MFNGWDYSIGYYNKKHNSNFVKPIVRFKGYDDGRYYERDIPHHKCTEEEYAEFYPIVSSDEGYLQLAKYAGGLYCIDWDIEEPHLIFGEHANYVS